MGESLHRSAIIASILLNLLVCWQVSANDLCDLITARLSRAQDSDRAKIVLDTMVEQAQSQSYASGDGHSRLLVPQRNIPVNSLSPSNITDSIFTRGNHWVPELPRTTTAGIWNKLTRAEKMAVIKGLEEIYASTAYSYNILDAHTMDRGGNTPNPRPEGVPVGNMVRSHPDYILPAQALENANAPYESAKGKYRGWEYVGPARYGFSGALMLKAATDPERPRIFTCDQVHCAMMQNLASIGAPASIFSMHYGIMSSTDPFAHVNLGVKGLLEDPSHVMVFDGTPEFPGPARIRKMRNKKPDESNEEYALHLFSINHTEDPTFLVVKDLTDAMIPVVEAGDFRFIENFLENTQNSTNREEWQDEITGLEKVAAGARRNYATRMDTIIFQPNRAFVKTPNIYPETMTAQQYVERIDRIVAELKKKRGE